MAASSAWRSRPATGPSARLRDHGPQGQALRQRAHAGDDAPRLLLPPARLRPRDEWVLTQPLLLVLRRAPDEARPAGPHGRWAALRRLLLLERGQRTGDRKRLVQ